MAAKATAKKGAHQVAPSQRQQIRARNMDPALTHEHPDPMPVHIPGKTDVTAPLPLREEMQRYVRAEVSRAAEEHEAETFEEANDFEIPDDQSDITSPYSDVVYMADEASESLDGVPNAEDLSSSLQTQEAPAGASEGAESAETGGAPAASDAPERDQQ